MTDLPVLPILASCISSQRSFPSRVRSPTPANTEKPLCTVAMRAISSGEDDRLAQPGAAEQADLAAADERGQQVDDLDARLEHARSWARAYRRAGGSRWIGRRSSALTGPRPSIGSPSRLNTRPSVSLPTGTLTGLPVSMHGHAADQAVGRAQGHAADAIAAEVLLDFAGQVDLHALDVAVDRQGVVDVGQVPFVELGVEGRADHLGNSSGHRRGCHRS